MASATVSTNNTDMLIQYNTIDQFFLKYKLTPTITNRVTASVNNALYNSVFGSYSSYDINNEGTYETIKYP